MRFSNLPLHAQFDVQVLLRQVAQDSANGEDTFADSLPRLAQSLLDPGVRIRWVEVERQDFAVMQRNGGGTVLAPTWSEVMDIPSNRGKGGTWEDLLLVCHTHQMREEQE